MALFMCDFNKQKIKPERKHSICVNGKYGRNIKYNNNYIERENMTMMSTTITIAVVRIKKEKNCNHIYNSKHLIFQH